MSGNSIRTLSIVGLGKLGLPLAASFAERGFRVIGVDNVPAVVDSVNAGRTHIYEPGLPDLLAEVVHKGNLVATGDIGWAVRETDTTIILVPTPSQDDGAFTNEYVLQVCEELCPHLAIKEGYHLVVIASTVMPGSCSGPIREALEASGRQVGQNLGLCYCPEFVALGDAIAGFQQPDFVLIGQSDPVAGQRLADIYARLCRNDPPIVRVSLVNAETAKVSLNFAVTAKITAANTLAEICESIPGADVDEVTRVIGHDRRIGHAYLTGGAAFGGTCFPRDVLALLALAVRGATGAILPEAVHRVNQHQIERLCYKIDAALKRAAAAGLPDVVAVLGLAFKPDTDVTEQSTGLALVERYQDRCVVYDPLATCLRSVRTPQIAVSQAGVVVVTTRHKEFKSVVCRPGQVVIDCWRWLDVEKVRRLGATYIGIGIGPEEA